MPPKGKRAMKSAQARDCQPPPPAMSDAEYMCDGCGKVRSKSNKSHHTKVCGKKKPPKTRKVISKESYERNREKILEKRWEQSVFEKYRRLEVAREELAKLESTPLPAQPIKDIEWEPLPTTNLLHGISKEFDLFSYFFEELAKLCQRLWSESMMMISWAQFYKAAMMVLHPVRLSRLTGDRFSDTSSCAVETQKILSLLRQDIEAKNPLPTREEIRGMQRPERDIMLDKYYEAEEKEYRATQKFNRFQPLLGYYRKKTRPTSRRLPSA